MQVLMSDAMSLQLATDGFGLGAGEKTISTMLIPIAIGTDVQCEVKVF